MVAHLEGPETFTHLGPVIFLLPLIPSASTWSQPTFTVHIRGQQCTALGLTLQNLLGPSHALSQDEESGSTAQLINEIFYLLKIDDVLCAMEGIRTYGCSDS